MKNNDIKIEDYHFRYNAKGVLSIRHNSKHIITTNVFDEYEKTCGSSNWQVVNYPVIEAGRMELLEIFLRNAVEEYELYGRFQ